MWMSRLGAMCNPREYREDRRRVVDGEDTSRLDCLVSFVQEVVAIFLI